MDSGAGTGPGSSSRTFSTTRPAAVGEVPARACTASGGPMRPTGRVGYDEPARSIQASECASPAPLFVTRAQASTRAKSALNRPT
jgi:hypothetical protein